MNFKRLSDEVYNYEYDADLENHQFGNQKIYRLYYINYFRAENNRVGLINYPFEPFVFPEDMSRDDGFKVLSYLTDFIEREANIKPCSLKSVKSLDMVLDIERLGFKKVDELNEDKILNLFTIDGRIALFKKCGLYPKYFEWYTEGITFDEIKDIYDKCGMNFYDLIPTSKKRKLIKNDNL